LVSNGSIEHPAYRDTINMSAFDAESDQPAREYVHDQNYSVTAQEDRFAAQQVDAP